MERGKEAPRVPVERGVALYQCRACAFNSTDPQLAARHDLEENRGRRADSQWRHQLEVLAVRDSPAQPCPACGTGSYSVQDLKSHMVREHTPDSLVDTIILLKAQNLRLTAVARGGRAEVRLLAKQRDARGKNQIVILDDGEEEGPSA